MADANTTPIIPPEIQELLTGRAERPTESKPSEQAADAPQDEPKLYKSHDEILADEEFVSKLIDDPRVQERVQKAADEAAAQRVKADELRKEQEATVKAAREDEDRLETLRRTSPTAYAEEMGRRRVSEKAQRDRIEYATALANDVNGALTKYVREHFPKEAVDSLAGKKYDGSYADGVAAYFDDITKAAETHLRSRWEKEELPALRKRVLTELNGGEETIDATQRGSVSKKEFATEEEMAIAFQNDKITHEEMRAWYRAHGVRRR